MAQENQQRRSNRNSPPKNQGLPDMIERVVQINHVAKVVKGGRRFGFSTIVVVGDGKGKVGVSIGKAKEVPESISKGRSGAVKSMKKIKIVNGTIPHEIVGICGATRILLRPAVPGTGIIAGKSVRAILEASGIHDVLSKTLGSSNAVNVVKATMDGLARLQLPEEVAEMRGKTVGEMFIAKKVRRQLKMDEEMALQAKMANGPSEPPSPTSNQSQRRRDGGQGQQRSSAPGSSQRPRGRGYEGQRPQQDRRPDRKPQSQRPDSEGSAGSGAPHAPTSPASPEA